MRALAGTADTAQLKQVTQSSQQCVEARGPRGRQARRICAVSVNSCPLYAQRPPWASGEHTLCQCYGLEKTRVVVMPWHVMSTNILPSCR
eukprot:3457270-Prymnesium_polylepis.2